MKRSGTQKIIVVLVLALSAVCYAGEGLNAAEAASAGTGPAASADISSASAPDPTLAAFVPPKAIGTYKPDGTFQRTRKSHWYRQISEVALTREPLRPVEVPPHVDMRPIETVVEDYAPPNHARKIMQKPSRFGSFFDGVVTFVYGRENVLLGPTHITTDSQGRVIISDPERKAVHVLDGTRSFRIAGGPGRRLQRPGGVAVDKDDNIYIADGKLGMVLVYDKLGRFVRSIGTFSSDEGMFHEPTAIAIDADAGHLYVLDTPSNELVVFDLRGNVVKCAGGRRDRTGATPFNSPTEIAVRNGLLVVLDSDGTRIQVFDLHCNRLHAFKIRHVNGEPLVPEMGLALDSGSNIYVSTIGVSVKIYRPDGQLIAAFPHGGVVSAPSGLWIDAGDRIYVSDAFTGRVRVLRPAMKAAAARPATPMAP
ncbi:MAG: 6-bladed beta-propeller [Terriglobales bacterium]